MKRLWVVLMLVGCGTADVGDEGENGAEDEACACFEDQDCCEAGLFCYAPTPCNVETDTGCHTEGTCIALRSSGELCGDARECASLGSVCSSPTLEEDPTCKTPDEGQECYVQSAVCSWHSDCCSGTCNGGNNGFTRGLCG